MLLLKYFSEFIEFLENFYRKVSENFFLIFFPIFIQSKGLKSVKFSSLLYLKSLGIFFHEHFCLFSVADSSYLWKGATLSNVALSDKILIVLLEILSYSTFMILGRQFEVTQMYIGVLFCFM